MATAAEIPIPYRIVALMQERNRLFAYPLEQLAMEIRSTRFRCNGCGACCTRAVNSHIFLLDHDIAEVRTIDPAAYEPAPDPEFCDQNGTLYVSGYALRMKNDAPRACWFLEESRCRIYDRRFSGCRIYPHMLRRSINLAGEVTWQQFARKNRHGCDDPALSPDECLALARQIKEYENAYLTQQISFLETIQEFFSVFNLFHDPALRTRQLMNSTHGEEVPVMVYHAGELHEHRYGTPDAKS
jgi:uncharacterized protein